MLPRDVEYVPEWTDLPAQSSPADWIQNIPLPLQFDSEDIRLRSEDVFHDFLTAAPTDKLLNVLQENGHAGATSVHAQSPVTRDIKYGLGTVKRK